MVKNVKTEENENVEQNQQSAKLTNKEYFVLECIICSVSLVVFLAITLIAAYCQMSDGARIALIVVAMIDLLASCFSALYIEVKVGYHICSKCGHKHQPSYLKTIIAPHIGFTRYMKCPKCGDRNWQKKKF